MRQNASHRSPAAVVAVIAAVCVVGLVALPGPVGAAGGTEVLLDAGDDRVAVAETTTVDLVISDAQGGVGGFVAQVKLADPDAGTITDVTFSGEPGLTDVAYRDGGSRAAFGAVLMDTADIGPVTVATVTVVAEEPGAVELTLTGVRGNPEPTVADEAGAKYDLTGLSGTSLTVEAGDGPPPTAPAPGDDDDELDLGDWFGSDSGQPSATSTTTGTTTAGTSDGGSTTTESSATATTADGDDEEPTTGTPTVETPTVGATTDAGIVTAAETTTTGGQPGFGLAVAAVALAGAGLLRLRRTG